MLRPIALLIALAAPAGGAGDLPAAADASRRALAKTLSRPGIYPVYEAGGRWMLIDRETDKSKRRVRKGGYFVVIGSRGVEVFRVAKTTRTWIAACEANRSVPRTGYLLTARKAAKFKRVGTPIIALRLPAGKSFDTNSAWFYPLKNGVREETYQKLQTSLRSAIVADLQSGAFQIDVSDEKGHAFAAKPEADLVQMKIDFGSKIRYRGLKNAFLLVEGTQISKTYRRCMRLYDGDKPIGHCAEMPHELNVETRQMRFVAYDPNRRGRPYIFAYTKREPLWGHERWGFLLADSGPTLFMRDALDPRCRAGF